MYIKYRHNIFRGNVSYTRQHKDWIITNSDILNVKYYISNVFLTTGKDAQNCVAEWLGCLTFFPKSAS